MGLPPVFQSSWMTRSGMTNCRYNQGTDIEGNLRSLPLMMCFKNLFNKSCISVRIFVFKKLSLMDFGWYRGTFAGTGFFNHRIERRSCRVFIHSQEVWDDCSTIISAYFQLLLLAWIHHHFNGNFRILNWSYPPYMFGLNFRECPQKF